MVQFGSTHTHLGKAMEYYSYWWPLFYAETLISWWARCPALIYTTQGLAEWLDEDPNGKNLDTRGRLFIDVSRMHSPYHNTQYYA